MRRLLLAAALLALLPTTVAAGDWTTFGGGNGRQGYDGADPGLAGAAVRWNSPQLDGEIYAQPLIVGNQVIAATENNTVYSLDSSNGDVQWSTHLGAPRTSAITCGDINPQGITSTPVVSGGDLYVVANIQTGSSSFFFELARLSLATGSVSWTADVDPPDTGNPSGITWSGEALTMEDRGALLATGGRILIPMGGNYGDCGGYHGYLVSYPETGPGGGSLQWWASTEVDAGDSQGADWAAGGPSEDAQGYVYVATGNGDHGSPGDAYDYSDGVIKLDPGNLQPGAPVDYFAPSDWYADNANDADLGSTTPLQLPGNRVFQIGKSGIGYLLDSQSLGHIGGQLAAHQVCHASNDAVFGSLAYAGGIVFVGCSDGLAAVEIACSNADFSTIWYNTAQPADHPPTVAGGLVWSVSAGGGHLLGFSLTTGAEVTSFPITGSDHFTTPAAGDGLLAIGGGRYVDTFAAPVPAGAAARAVGGPTGAAVSTGPTPSLYQPLAPYRVLDTRTGTCVQCGAGALGAGETRVIQVGGYSPPGFTGTAVPATASAVVLNVTAVDTCAATYLTVFPAGESPPTASSLNPAPGQVIANLVTVALGTSGGSPGYVDILNASGSIDVVADVEGYYANASGTAAGGFHPLSPPVRVCDTRTGQPANPCSGSGGGALGPGQGRLVAVTDGSTGVTTGGDAEAAALNLTAVEPTGGTYLTVYPPSSGGGGAPACGPPPLASNLNLPPGAIQPNRVISEVTQYQGAGYLCVFNAAGTVDVILDVNGWYGTAAAGGGAAFYPMSPVRICDSRAGTGTECSGMTPGPGATLPVGVEGVGGIPASGVAALAANVTGVQGSTGTYLSVYPAAASPPGTSDLNPAPGEIIANFALVAVAADGEVDVHNAAGSIDVIIDAVGWFS